jgi:hypothetical protein
MSGAGGGGSGGGPGGSGAGMGEMAWRAWKTQLVPLLYDWYSHHKMAWPSQAVR